MHGTNSDLGSPGRVWENLKRMQHLVFVAGNRNGSYLTMFSKSGFIFGIIYIIGNFGAELELRPCVRILAIA